jgi:hypothetical protein
MIAPVTTQARVSLLAPTLPFIDLSASLHLPLNELLHIVNKAGIVCE